MTSTARRRRPPRRISMHRHASAGTAATFYWRARHLRARHGRATARHPGNKALRLIAAEDAHEVALHTERPWAGGRAGARGREHGRQSPDPRNQRSRRGQLLPLPRRPNVLWADSTGVGVHGADQPSPFPAAPISRRSKPTARSASSTSSACPTTSRSTVRAPMVKRSRSKRLMRSHAARVRARSCRCSIIPTSISISCSPFWRAGVSTAELTGRRDESSIGGAQATSATSPRSRPTMTRSSQDSALGQRAPWSSCCDPTEQCSCVPSPHHRRW